jgi:hypothetical protein
LSKLIGDTDRIARAGDLLTTEVDGEIVAMSVAGGAIYGFDEVTTHIWHLLETPRALGDLCAELVRTYDVGDAECREAVIEVLAILHADGLVEISPAPR